MLGVAPLLHLPSLSFAPQGVLTSGDCVRRGLPWYETDYVRIGVLNVSSEQHAMCMQCQIASTSAPRQ